MQRADLLKLVGRDGAAEYTPVAFLLKNGYACAGSFNAKLNEDMEDTCVLLNCRMVELSADRPGGRGISDFNEFLEDVISSGLAESDTSTDEFDVNEHRFGRPVPLVAVPLSEVAVLYPVSHIETLIRRSQETQLAPVSNGAASSLLDFQKSEILAVLTTKLW